MIILNEKVYAEDCLKGIFNENKPLLTLFILAKYYCHVMNYGKSKTIDSLYQWMDKYYPQYTYNKNYWTDKVESVVVKAKKHMLQEIDGVRITESELSTIESIHNKTLERLAFTTLCIAKLNVLRNPTNNGWVTTDDKEIFTLARISGTAAERRTKIGRLFDLGLLKNSKRIDNLSYQVTFIDDDSPCKLIISDFRELGYEYMLYKGGNFVRCRECGILCYNNTNHTRAYCSKCVAPMGTKWIACISCGEMVEVDVRNNRTKRCPACQHQASLEMNNIRKRKFRENGTLTKKDDRKITLP